ncbi:MAG TPA: YbjN domain-containing protein [Candidatus Oscillibacter pullicola]|nr:YbjN domain-containing protein [Candidatus Oscillibacter pullicola]
MDLAKQKQFFQILEQKLNGMGMQTAAAAGAGAPQIGDTLRVLVPITDEGEAVLLELMAAAIDEETDLLQFYTTMVMELAADRGQLARTLMQWNFLCPLGSFGVFEEGNQLYHKYGILLTGEEELDRLAEHVIEILSVLYEVLEQKFPAAKEFSRKLDT